ncbi:Co-chaperone HscB, C-terminal oligomerization domain-containing protein [Dendryphion nanum]|uniref:Co-chaperone HscB, C-terminal oligomerization domain-containing protein n=1 Tax=Dendryphion nanum TaxID=256645 RepID=A0A9P9DRW1_9PLEO|nr:Co-chaperone HscB, C-terminal oligomerization domain-containing protein [Dendryphion nanum]
MRPVVAIPTRLRAAISLESSTSPLRTRTRPAPCIWCAHRIPSQSMSRRFQSTNSAAATASKEDTNAPPQTHYTFFPKSVPAGPPPHGQFAIDLNALKREFLQLQSRAHPDLHPQESKKKAQALSARINEAYKTLSSPLHRAQYLLSLRGVSVADDETAKVEDPELLMEVLEARERIEEAEKEEDLAPMKQENDARVEESVRILERQFEEDNIQGAVEEAVKLRYWVNIKESLDAWEKGKPVVLSH